MDYMSSLAQLDKVPVDMQLEGLAGLRSRRINDNLDLQKMFQANEQERVMNPMRVEEQRLRNQGMGVDIRTKEATLADLTRKNRMAESTYDAELGAKLSKLYADASDDDLKQAENDIILGLQRMSNNPVARQQLLFMHDFTKKEIEARKAHARKLAEIEAAGQWGVNRAQATGNKAPTPPKDPRQLYTFWLMKAQNAANEAEAAEYVKQADIAWQKVIEEAAAKAGAGKAGSIDAGAATGMPTIQAPQAQPTPNPKATTQQQPQQQTNSIQEGTKSKSKSGKPIVFRNGRWEYE